jgi:hypothetical protein
MLTLSALPKTPIIFWSSPEVLHMPPLTLLSNTFQSNGSFGHGERDSQACFEI